MFRFTMNRKLRTLRLTDAICTQLDRVEAAAKIYPNPDDGFFALEIEKLKLADLIAVAIAAQTARADRLPQRAVPVVVEIAMRPKRRQRP